MNRSILPYFWITWYIVMVSVFTGCLSNKNTLSYLLNCEKAEMAIIKSDYRKALKLYKKAFKSNHPGFSDDYYNALKVADLLKENDFAFYNAKKLAKRGLCNEFFQNYEMLKSDKDQWDELLGLEFRTKNDFRLELESMTNDDQVARYDRSDSQNINKVDSINFFKFKMLIERYGFPSEESLGIECTDNTRGFHPPPYNILLLHFAQHRYEGVKQILDDALEKNKISPYRYIDLMQYLGLPVKYNSAPVVKMGQDYFTYKKSDLDISKINSNRERVGAGSLENHLEKIKFRIKNGRNEFRMNTGIDFVPQQTKSVIDSFFVKLDLE